MITKKSTVFLIFMSCIIVSWLFHLKYSSTSIENRIRTAKHSITEELKNQHILRAEWKSLISPERIQRLSQKHLDLQQMDPTQLHEYDPSIFHSEKSKYKKTKKLSEIVNAILSKDIKEDGQ